MNARIALKTSGRAVATLCVVPLLISYWIRSTLVGADRALEGSTETLSLAPGIAGQYLRRAFLARTLSHCAASATIGFGVLISQRGARIDEEVYIGPRCHLGLVHLEEGVLLAPGVQIPSGAHTHGTDPSLPIRQQQGTRRLIRIGKGAWIGAGSVILADVGRDTIVGAGAVVTQPLPDRVLAAGVPARVLRHRDAAGSRTA
jgi:acetyltransferase-like isoleucine patch superfamily enzyme